MKWLFPKAVSEGKSQGNLQNLLKPPGYMFANHTRCQCGKIFMFRVMFLKNWADEIVNRRSPSKRQRLVDELKQAVEREEFERAAKIRDRLNKLKE